MSRSRNSPPPAFPSRVAAFDARPRAAIVTFRGYEMHARRESEALVDAGYDVDIILLRRDGQPRRESIGNLHFTRVGIPKTRTSPIRYLFSYVQWFVTCFGLLTIRHLRRRYALVQVTSLPDHQVFAALIPKLLGARVVLFCKEPASELFRTISGSNLAVNIMKFLELRAIGFADLTFTVTDQHRQFYLDRGADPAKVGVIVNSTPNSALKPRTAPPALSETDTVTLIYPGTIEERWGHECIVRALAEARTRHAGLRLVITGEGDYEADLRDLVDELDLTAHVEFRGWVSLDELQQIFESADIGLVAQQESTYSNLVHTGKMYEYMMFGLPIIASRLNATEAYFGSDIITYYEPDDHHDLADALVGLARDPELRLQMAKAAQEAFAPYRWTEQRQIYLDGVTQPR